MCCIIISNERCVKSMENIETINALKQQIALRITKLRENAGVTSKEMSIDLKYSESYMSKIESQKIFPSVKALARILDYLHVTAEEFFETDSIDPALIQEINENLKKLDKRQLRYIADMVEDLADIAEKRPKT